MPPTHRILFTYLTPETFRKSLGSPSTTFRAFVAHNGRNTAEGVIVAHRDVLTKLQKHEHFDPIMDAEGLLRGFVGSVGIKEQAHHVYLTHTMNPYDFRVVVSDIQGQELMIQRFDFERGQGGKYKGWYDCRTACTVVEDEIMSFLLFSLLQETGQVEGMPDIEVKA